MAKSSFNTQVAERHSSAHNQRLDEPTYLFDHNAKNEYKVYIVDEPDEYLKKAKKITKEKTGKTMQKSASDTFWHEAVINVKENTTIEDIEKLFNEINKELAKSDNTKRGFTLREIAIHRDEGVFIQSKYSAEHLTHDSKKLKWYNQNGEDVTNEVVSFRPKRDVYYNKKNKTWYKDSKFKEKADISGLQKWHNYHAHAVYTKHSMATGKTARPTPTQMSKIQDITSEILGMERGLKGSDTVRETHWQRKKKHDIVNDLKKEFLYNYKELRKEITSLEDANSEQKKELHKLNSKIKNTNDESQKDELIAELDERLSKFKTKKIKINEKLTKTSDEIIKENKKTFGYDMDNIKKEIDDKNNLVELLVTRINSQPDLSELEKENQSLKQELAESNKLIKSLKRELEENNRYIQELREELEVTKRKSDSYYGLNSELKSEISTLKSKIKDFEDKYQSDDEKGARALENRVKEFDNQSDKPKRKINFKKGK